MEVAWVAGECGIGQSVIAQGCGQTLGLGLVDRNRTVGNY